MTLVSRPTRTPSGSSSDVPHPAMAAQHDTPDQPPAATRRRSRQTCRTASDAPPADTRWDAAAPEAPTQGPEEDDIAAELSFREAQIALELSLAELQAPDLDVEEMAGLYQRANRYADRCEQLLQQVEQQVMQWDPGQPQEPPVPYQP